MVCKYCGAELNEDNNVCPACGKEQSNQEMKSETDVGIEKKNKKSKSTKKKLIFIIAAVLVVAGIGVGATFGVIQKQKKVQAMDEEYEKGLDKKINDVELFLEGKAYALSDYQNGKGYYGDMEGAGEKLVRDSVMIVYYYIELYNYMLVWNRGNKTYIASEIESGFVSAYSYLGMVYNDGHLSQTDYSLYKTQLDSYKIKWETIKR